MKKEAKIETPKDVDRIISAEFPDLEQCAGEEEKARAKIVLELVKKYMLHSCSSRCRKEGEIAEQCTKFFPKDYSEVTVWNQNGYYPTYRRRRGNWQQLSSGKIVDNSYIVAYSPYLLMKYRTHINVEVCV